MDNNYNCLKSSQDYKIYKIQNQKTKEKNHDLSFYKFFVILQVCFDHLSFTF